MALISMTSLSEVSRKCPRKLISYFTSGRMPSSLGGSRRQGRKTVRTHRVTRWVLNGLRPALRSQSLRVQAAHAALPGQGPSSCMVSVVPGTCCQR